MLFVGFDYCSLRLCVLICLFGYCFTRFAGCMVSGFGLECLLCGFRTHFVVFVVTVSLNLVCGLHLRFVFSGIWYWLANLLGFVG